MSFNDQKLKDENSLIQSAGLIKAGTRRFLKVVIVPPLDGEVRWGVKLQLLPPLTPPAREGESLQ